MIWKLLIRQYALLCGVIEMKAIDNYWKPTPKKWRKIGDALLATSTFITGAAIIGNYHTLGLIFLIIGAVGKFLTNFFAETNNA